MVGSQAQRHHGAYDDLPVTHDRPVLHRGHTQNRDLRLIYDRREALYAVHAEVCDRKRAAPELLHRQPAFARELCQFFQLGRYLRKALFVGIRDIRHNEAVVKRDRNTHVHIVLVDYLVVLDRAVEQREFRQRSGDEFYQQVGIADLDVLPFQLLPVMLHGRHVYGEVERDRRRGHM